MSPLSVPAIPENEQPLVLSLLKDMRTALSHLAFYPPDSPFVTDAVAKFYDQMEALLAQGSPLAFQAKENALLLNGTRWEDAEVVVRALWAHACPGFVVGSGLTRESCEEFLRILAAPPDKGSALRDRLGEAGRLPGFAWLESETVEVVGPIESTQAPPPPVASTPSHGGADSSVLTLEDLHNAPDLETAPELTSMLTLVAEAWQLSHQVGKHLQETPQAKVFQALFHRFFRHFLHRLGTVSGELESIQGWFHCPEGEEVAAQTEEAMRGLLAVAIKKGYTGVLYDSSAEGLVSDCLSHWGATGEHELLERTVEALAKGLQLDPDERELSLTHLMDSRPWVSNTRLVGILLDHLTSQLSEETVPSLYQKGLLMAWDLLEPALRGGLEQQVLALLSTLHLHADDEAPAFPDRPALVRQWIYGKSNPDLVRDLVALAHRHHRLSHFPILATLAAPILLDDFYAAAPEDIPRFLRYFSDMREQIRVALMERLPRSSEEMEVRLLMLIVGSCGVDPALSLQISAWMAKGSRGLKENILSTIEEVGDPCGGPALRLALLDDDEEIAMEAARVLAHLRFKPAVPMLLKAVQVRKKHGKPTESFQVAVCRALGVFALPETLPYLMEQTRRKGFFTSGSPLVVREAAARALVHFGGEEAEGFLEALVRESEESVRRAVEEERRSIREAEETPTLP